MSYVLLKQLKLRGNEISFMDMKIQESLLSNEPISYLYLNQILTEIAKSKDLYLAAMRKAIKNHRYFMHDIELKENSSYVYYFHYI